MLCVTAGAQQPVPAMTLCESDSAGNVALDFAVHIACAARSVVSVLPVWPDNASRNEEPEGSAIVVGDGTLLATADHVLGPALDVFVRTSDGVSMRATIVMRDAATDIALLRIKRPLPPVRFASSFAVAHRACAIGNSFGLDISVACGIVSAVQVSGVGFNPIEDFVQTDAAVNPGMSGGALVNEEGALIGLLSAIFTKGSDSNIGVNFAVSAALLQRVLDDYLDDGIVSHPKSAMVVRPTLAVTSPAFSGMLVVRVKAGSIEEKAGMRADDVILSANGRRLKRAGSYRAAAALTGSGNRLTLRVARGGDIKDIAFHLE